jgi:aminocarboxymuconate-semialdehyde decarboxylase
VPATRRARPEAVDVHTHFYPPQYLRLLQREGASFGFGVSEGPAGRPVVEAGTMRIGPLADAFTDLTPRLAAMDRLGVKVQALSLTFPMVYWADATLGRRLSQAFNDAAAEAHAAHPDRFVGLAVLPMQDPGSALAELERAARLPGIRGVYMGTGVRDRELDDPAFLPVYERLQSLDLPLFLHPVDLISAPRLSAYYLGNLVGHPFDTTLAAARLIFGGVLDRLPRLRVCLAHGGGALPYLIGRLDRGWKVRPECRHLRRAPHAYLRRFDYDTITHSADALAYLVARVGAGRVLLGSDYCFSMGSDRPVEVVTRAKGLAAADRARIVSGNASRLLRLR